VFSKLTSGQLNLHGWIYNIKTGVVESYNEETKEYVEL
jgi:carbonic anhydrase